MSKSHKDLIVWQKAIHLVTLIYKSTSYFPKEELYGLARGDD
ncbi:MAG: 23S ribosomal protein [Candidatus Yanofskybacteria bacterium GW2011_GWA1_48_10]|uniref:23S ribosomal protein n=1 Tax=Candidatus Yanofskybacteria bacterium GW2011_GWA1_48_10 TaxID=1619022 RepID=A0A0G1U6A4_9BACT|nr:MAG: 23S ribosomal protein [Candidatus Yanofskybacteria bacterium GW2011_GWA1_48_10]